MKGIIHQHNNTTSEQGGPTYHPHGNLACVCVVILSWEAEFIVCAGVGTIN